MPGQWRLGVARVASATRLATAALSAAREAARAFRGGRFEALDAPFGYPDVQRLYTHD